MSSALRLIKTQQQIKQLPYQQQIEFYQNNMIYSGDSTPEDIHFKMMGDKRFAQLIASSQVNDEEKVKLWEKCWLFANEENHDREFYLLNGDDAEESEVQKNWQNVIDEYYKIANDVNISDEDVEAVKEKAKMREHFSLKEEFMQLFNQKSYCNQLIGECLFYSFIMVLLRKQGVMIESSNSMTDRRISPIPIFAMQKSGTGKDQSLDFLQELIIEMNRIIKERGQDDKLIRYENLSGGESPEVYFNRPKLKPNGSIEFEGDVPGRVLGKLERNDVILVRECSFLFRIKNNEKQNILEILLQTLEGREIGKELVSWNGFPMLTSANCAYIGMSRPVHEVQDVITNSGLLQRGLFYGRNITRDEQQTMDEAILNNMPDKIKYGNNFKRLAVKIVDFYLNIDSKKFRLKNSQMGKKLIFDYKKSKRDFIYDEVQSPLMQEALGTFINRADEICVKLSYVNCYARGGDVPDEADIQNTLGLIDKIFSCLITWVEESLKDDRKAEKNNLEGILIKTFLKHNLIKQAEIIKTIIRVMHVSHPTAMKKLKETLVGKNKIFTEESLGIYSLNK